MPDIRMFQSNVDVKIKLYPQDLADIITQPEVLAGYSSQELCEISAAINKEIETRKEKQDGQ